MNKEYYYLEDNIQKGPYTLDQLKSIGLKPDYLIWCEGMENWEKAKNIPELSEIFKKLPPPPPILIENANIVNSKPILNQPINNIVLNSSNVKFWVKFKIISFTLLIIVIALLIVAMYINNKKQVYKKRDLFKN